MKKILILLVTIFILYSCFNSNSTQEISEAKKELLSQDNNTDSNIEDTFLSQDNTDNLSTEDNMEKGITTDGIIIEKTNNNEETQDVEEGFDAIDEESKSINPQVPELQVTTYDDLSNLTCENLDDFLQGLSGYYYWNTCRDLNEDILTNYFLEVNSGKYEYSKLYFNKSTNNFGKLFLESGEVEDLENVPTINSELKNKEFNIVEVGDELFINY